MAIDVLIDLNKLISNYVLTFSF